MRGSLCQKNCMACFKIDSSQRENYDYSKVLSIRPGLGSRPGLTFLTFIKIWFKDRGSDKRNIFFRII